MMGPQRQPYSLSTVIPFGKYKGLTVEAVAKFNALYLHWMKTEAGAVFTDEALAHARKAWTREHRQKTENMNGWAWGFGRAVKAANDKRSNKLIEIEIEERRKAGLTPQEQPR